MELLYGIIIIVIGIITLLLGVKLFRVWLALNGGLLGWALGAQVGEIINRGQTLSIILAIGIAVLCALLIYYLYKIGFVLSGALLMALLLSSLADYLETFPDWVYYALLIGGAILGGLLAFKFFRPYIIIATSFYGAYISVLGIYSIVTNQQIVTIDGFAPMVLETVSLSWPLYAAIFILTVFGIVFQTRKFGASNGTKQTRTP